MQFFINFSKPAGIMIICTCIFLFWLSEDAERSVSIDFYSEIKLNIVGDCILEKIYNVYWE